MNSDIKEFFAKVAARQVQNGEITYVIVNDGDRLRPASIALKFRNLIRILAHADAKQELVQLGIKYLDDQDVRWDEFPFISSDEICLVSSRLDILTT